jgi:hypothetical protein
MLSQKGTISLPQTKKLIPLKAVSHPDQASK